VALPTGRITMLFIDIEGSTPLLRGLGDLYGEVLSDQRTIIRSGSLHTVDMSWAPRVTASSSSSRLCSAQSRLQSRPTRARCVCVAARRHGACPHGSVARGVGDDERVAAAMSKLGILDLSTGRTNRAIAAFEEALAIDTRNGDRWAIAVDRTTSALR